MYYNVVCILKVERDQQLAVYDHRTMKSIVLNIEYEDTAYELQYLLQPIGTLYV